MVNGRVCIGFSHPTVGLYSCTGGKVTYTDGRRLARGVSVSTDTEYADDNTFYADNAAAETAEGEFVGGTASVEVDGLLMEAERMVYGLPEPEEVAYGETKVQVTRYGKLQPPYVGFGYIKMWRSGGVDSYEVLLLTKVKFAPHGEDAKTKKKDINWQTQELEAAMHVDDTAHHDYMLSLGEYASEAEALAVLDAVLAVAAAEET